MDVKRVRKIVIFCAVAFIVFLLGTAIAADRCSEKKALELETVLAELDCSEQDAAVIREVFSDQISECDHAMIAGICSPNAGDKDLTEENSWRLELNNTTVREKSR